MPREAECAARGRARTAHAQAAQSSTVAVEHSRSLALSLALPARLRRRLERADARCTSQPPGAHSSSLQTPKFLVRRGSCGEEPLLDMAVDRPLLHVTVPEGTPLFFLFVCKKKPHADRAATSFGARRRGGRSLAAQLAEIAVSGQPATARRRSGELFATREEQRQGPRAQAQEAKVCT